MIGLTLLLFSQLYGDTLRWYDPETAGWSAFGFSNDQLDWAVIFPIDSSLAGRTVHSGRVNMWEPMIYSGTMRLCTGTLDSPVVVLDSGSFFATDSLTFYEVFFGDTITLNQGDLIWLWCTQPKTPTQFPASLDSGPAVLGYGDLLITGGGGHWGELYSDEGLNYNWVMELILTPQEVQEGPLPGPPEELTLLMAPEGFLISGYEGPVQVYDSGGRLIMSREIEGKTLISPLKPGVYFMRAGRQRGKITVR